MWLLVGLAAVVFVVASRAELPAVGRALRHSHALWVLAGLGCAVAWAATFAVLHAVAQRAAGLTVGPRRQFFAAMVAGHFLNLVTKSGAMAGAMVVDGVAERDGKPRGRVIGAYVLAAVAGQIAFGIVLAAAFVLIVADGRLTRAEAVAGIVFLVYLGVEVVVVVAAFGSQRRTRALLATPRRWWARVRRQSSVVADHSRADELHAAMSLVRASPGRATAVLGVALLLEAIGVAMLWCALRAVNAPHTPKDALVAYAVSVLFAIVGFLPGGLGFVEVSLGAMVVSLGGTVPTATAAVAVYRLLEFWLPVAAGAVALQLLRRRGALA